MSNQLHRVTTFTGSSEHRYDDVMRKTGEPVSVTVEHNGRLASLTTRDHGETGNVTPFQAQRPTAVNTAIDAMTYRKVLGHYPTGVCVVTGRSPDGETVGMVVGSFSSVSLDPPLVAFFPDRKSGSWARLRTCDRFCVNVLGAHQEALCRKLASRDPDKFAGVAHRTSSHGNPVLDGAIAWIECDRHSIVDAGDHEMVMGRVIALDLGRSGLPLLFFQGGYGCFAPVPDLADQQQGAASAS